MSKNNWIKFLFGTSIILLWLLIVLSFDEDSGTQPWRKKDVDMRVAIPPELLGGNILSIGDNLDKVEQIEHLVPFEAHDPIFGKTYSSGVYRGIRFKYIDVAYFNLKNELIRTRVLVNNNDNLCASKLFVKTAGTLMKYYGDNYQVFGRLRDSTIFTMIRWTMSEKTNVELSGELLNSETELIYPDIYETGSMSVNYNYVFDDFDTVGRSKIYSLLKNNEESMSRNK